MCPSLPCPVRLSRLFPARLFAALMLLLAAASSTVHAQTLRPAAAAATTQLRAATGEPAALRASEQTGLVTFLRLGGEGIDSGRAADAPAEDRARSFLATHGAAFGVDGRRDLDLLRASRPDDVGMEHVRFQQTVDGIPVTAGELMVHLRGDRVTGTNGRTLPDLDQLVLAPRRTPSQVEAEARVRFERALGRDDFTVSAPRLEVFNRGLVQGFGEHPTRLAWYVEAAALDVDERLWIDDEHGGELLRFSQLTDARSREVRDANSTSSFNPGVARGEGAPPTGDADTDAAYDFSGDAYDFFATFGRDSYDDAGATIVSVVDYCPSPGQCPYLNAFWNSQFELLVYGAGFPAADDVDVHEFTHAVTTNTAGLFYYMQSGALNESFSDIFGETVDLTNGAGNDAPGVRWHMGEDVPVFGAIRHMMDPTQHGDPDRVGDSTNFWCNAYPGLHTASDNGGVHVNSGVPNHAYALMADGGTFNSVTVNGIGLDKAGRIAYRVLDSYLLSGSGFRDAYDAWQGACQDLVGSHGITAGDCTEVGKALDAVEMDAPWPCADPNDAPTDVQTSLPDPCPAGLVPVRTFADDFEAGGAAWWVDVLAGDNGWFLDTRFATSGVQTVWGVNQDKVSDTRVRMLDPVVLPAGALLHFRHAFHFEWYSVDGVFYDGGILEYSIDGGSNWLDASSLIVDGADYTGTLPAGNPLGAVPAFVGTSFGYTATLLDLSSLAGEDFQLGFRLGTDPFVGELGWFIDDVSVHRCLPPDIFSDGFEAGNTSAWN